MRYLIHRPIAIGLFLFSSIIGWAQTEALTLDQAVKFARENNRSIRSAAYDVEAQQKLKKTGFDLPKTSVMLMYGQYNSYKNDNNITITQSIPFTALGSQAALNRSLVASSQLKKAVTENDLLLQVKQAYYLLAYTSKRKEILLQQDSIYEGFFKSASYRYRAGEGKLLEQVTAETQRNETKNQLMQNEADISVLQSQLKTLLGSASLPSLPNDAFTELSLTAIPDSSIVLANPTLAYQRQQVEVAGRQRNFAKAALAPDLLVGYFNQTLVDVINVENGTLASKGTRFTGFQVGIAIPLWFAPNQGRLQSAEVRRKSIESTYQYEQSQFASQLEQALQRYNKSKNSLAYYKTSALPNADLILKQAQTAFREGEVDYAEYLLSVKNALAIKEAYLLTLQEYNQSIIYIEYLSGNK